MGVGAWSQPSGQHVTEVGVPEQLDRPVTCAAFCTRPPREWTARPSTVWAAGEPQNKTCVISPSLSSPSRPVVVKARTTPHEITITWRAPLATVEGTAIQQFDLQGTGGGHKWGAKTGGLTRSDTWKEGRTLALEVGPAMYSERRRGARPRARRRSVETTVPPLVGKTTNRAPSHTHTHTRRAAVSASAATRCRRLSASRRSAPSTRHAVSSSVCISALCSLDTPRGVVVCLYFGALLPRHAARHTHYRSRRSSRRRSTRRRTSGRRPARRRAARRSRSTRRRGARSRRTSSARWPTRTSRTSTAPSCSAR